MLFRVARADQPLRFSQIAPADVPLPKAGKRFDVPGGGILYCATEAAGCYAEVLARFRPSAAVRAAVQDEDPGFMICGGVPADWRDRRLEVELDLVDALPFLDVEHEATHEYLTTAVAREMAALSIPLIDVGVIRGPTAWPPELSRRGHSRPRTMTVIFPTAGSDTSPALVTTSAGPCSRARKCARSPAPRSGGPMRRCSRSPRCGG